MRIPYILGILCCCIGMRLFALRTHGRTKLIKQGVTIAQSLSGSASQRSGIVLKALKNLQNNTTKDMEIISMVIRATSACTRPG